jgi:hypothetical protein
MQARMKNPAMILPDAWQGIQALLVLNQAAFFDLWALG